MKSFRWCVLVIAMFTPVLLGATCAKQAQDAVLSGVTDFLTDATKALLEIFVPIGG